MAKVYRSGTASRIRPAAFGPQEPGRLLFEAEFFDDAPAGAVLKVWTGSAWAAKPAKVWNGTAWIEKSVKVWTGSAWN